MASFFMPKVAESWFKKEAEENEDEWMKRPGESEADYENRLRHMGKEVVGDVTLVGPWKFPWPANPWRRMDMRLPPCDSMAEPSRGPPSPRKKTKPKGAGPSQPPVSVSERFSESDSTAEQPPSPRKKTKPKGAGPFEPPESESRPEYANRLKARGPSSQMEKNRQNRPWESEADFLNPVKSAKDRDLEYLRRRRDKAKARRARAREAKAAEDAEAAMSKDKGADAWEPEESVTQAGKPEAAAHSQRVEWKKGRLAMYQEMNSPNCSDDEEILQRVLQYKLDDADDAYMWEGAEEEERRAMVKAIQERVARTKKALFHWQHKLPTKDEESRKAQALVRGIDKPEESAIRQEVTVDDKETLEQVLQEKLDILDLEDVSNRPTKPAADPNSMIIQDDHVDRGKSALAKKTAEEEAVVFAEHRSRWEYNCCKDCDHFEHTTVLSSMLFTHYTPGMVPFNMTETLQIFSIKLKLIDENAGGFELPLSVYGMVAVRDMVDSRRNILFSCTRTRAQELTQDEPFLHLIGPSRAIVSEDMVYFEIKLKVKGAAASQDKPLIACARSYSQRISTISFENLFCTLEVCLQTVEEAVQATIVGVQMVHKEKLWPLNFPFGGRVACTPLPRTTADSGGDQEIVLIESKGGRMPQGDSGYVHLWREVVSVERGGGLDIVIQVYKKSGAVGAEGRAHFAAQNCKTSQQHCIVGLAQVTVTVAWSIVPTDMDDVMFNYA